MNSENYRNYYWDNLKGILIIFVLIGHFIQPYAQLGGLWCTIYLFHMPAFVFVTGFFSKRSSLESEKLLKFLVLLALFNVVLMIFSRGFHPSKWEYFRIYLSAWYLLAVILYRLTIPLLDKVNLPFFLLITTLCGICWGILQPADSFALYKLVPLYPFFVAGYWYGKKHPRSYIPQYKIQAKILAILCIALLILFGFWGQKHDVLNYNRLIWAPYYAGPRDAIVRLLLYIVGSLGTIALLILVRKRKSIYITCCGRNSLVLYVLHRPISIIMAHLIPASAWGTSAMLWLIVSFIFCIIVGNSRYFICCFNFVIDEIAGIIVKKRLTWLTLLYSCGICGFILFGWWGARWWKSHNQPLESYNDYMLRIISTREQQTLNSCFKISFIGDLILLRPQVQRGLTTSGEYNFDNMFKHTKKYFQTDDLTIAVWEGPCAGPEHAYSNSAYGDKPFIRLNFPDTFAKAAAKAGIDCVTVSTNHVLDCGVSAIPRTLAILENESIRHVGVASPISNQNSKPAHQMITLHDDFGNQIRIAILAYTYGSNYVPTSAFFTGEYKELLTCLVDKYSPYYQESLQRVKEEIRAAKAENPDCLLIMPHMGGQFNHAPDAFQKHWCTMFTELGADVILSDHPHATQPCEWRTRADGKKCLIIHCPGNYANSYTEMDGDAMAITEVYLNRKNGKPEACGVIPMWCLARGKGQYIPAPITDYIYGLAGGDLSNVDYKRLKEVSTIISKSMLGHEIPLHSASERYFTFANDEDKLIYRQASTAKLSADYISLFSIGKFLQNAKSICFVGDSITEGTKNLGYGWFEPLAAGLSTTKVNRYAKGGCTSQYFLENSHQIAAIGANIYVVAFGTNDIRYRNPDICAMTPDAYISNCSSFVKKIREKNPQAQFVFIAPWYSDIDDRLCILSNEEKDKMFKDYSVALRSFCADNNHRYADPNPIIKKHLNSLHVGLPWLVDDIHPNGTTGVLLYSKAFLETAQ